MSFCDQCFWYPQYCRSRKVRLVTDRELERPAFRYDVRVTLRSFGISPHRMRDFLTDCFRDSDCAIVTDSSGERVDFDLEAFEFETFPWWIRDLCRLPPSREHGRVRRERKEEFRVLATLLKLLFPDQARFWGATVANDNYAPATNDN